MQVLTPAQLAAALARAPRVPTPPQSSRFACAVAQRLIEGGLTFGEALELDAADAVGDLVDPNAIDEGCGEIHSEGARRCERLSLPAVAAPVAAW